MSFNADKCFTLHITRKRKTVEYNCMLHDYKLEVTTDGKYLGVTISNDLSWATRISNISAKANRTIGFLRRNIHSCPNVVKAAAYTTLVRPSIEYASAVWGPYTKNQTMQLDSIQRRAARFVNNNFYDREPGSVKAMISDLAWESRTKTSKDQSRINVQDCIYHQHYIYQQMQELEETPYLKPSCLRSDVYKYSYLPRTIITWSYIPQVLREVSTIDQFRTGLGSFTLPVQSTGTT